MAVHGTRRARNRDSYTDGPSLLHPFPAGCAKTGKTHTHFEVCSCLKQQNPPRNHGPKLHTLAPFLPGCMIFVLNFRPWQLSDISTPGFGFWMPHCRAWHHMNTKARIFRPKSQILALSQQAWCQGSHSSSQAVAHGIPSAISLAGFAFFISSCEHWAIPESREDAKKNLKSLWTQKKSERFFGSQDSPKALHIGSKSYSARNKSVWVTETWIG